MRSYSYEQDKYGGVILYSLDKEVYLQGDDATSFLNDMSALWELDDTKQTVKRSELRQHIISQYF